MGVALKRGIDGSVCAPVVQAHVCLFSGVSLSLLSCCRYFYQPNRDTLGTHYTAPVHRQRNTRHTDNSLDREKSKKCHVAPTSRTLALTSIPISHAMPTHESR